MTCCASYIDGQCRNPEARDALGYGAKPSPGVCKQCQHNTTRDEKGVAAWPMVNLTISAPAVARKPPEPLATEILAQRIAVCTLCEYLTQLHDRRDREKFPTVMVTCRKCTTCGNSKSL